MRNDQTDPPGDGELASWIRSHPEVWHFADQRTPHLDAEWAAHAVSDVVSGARARRRSVRRRRRITVAAVATGVLAVGGTAAALVFRPGQPTSPEAGVSCRATAAATGDAIVLAPGLKPIDGCRALWEQGRFVDWVGTTDVPDLSACIDPSGVIAVVPGAPTVCEDIGLAPADMALDATSSAVVALQDRFVSEVNSAPCKPVDEVAAAAEAILRDGGFSDWIVFIDPDSVSGVCGKAAVDSSTKTVTVHEF